MIRIYTGILLSNTKGQNNAIAATWMYRETAILSEVSQTQKDKYDIAYMWNLKKKKGANELIYKTEESEIQKTNLWLPGDGGSNKLGDCDRHIHTIIYKLDN